jgi:hypothetical protein
MMDDEYNNYLERKSQIGGMYGFEPIFMPDKAFDFQKHLIQWHVNKGRSMCAADCGLGKSLIELAFAQNIVEKTNGNTLLLTPIAVGVQMEKEAEKFGIEAKRSRDGKIKGKITITNYEQLHHFNPADFEALICDESSILKNFRGQYKQEITAFSRKIKYRLLATATAAPNDFIELGTSSEALGYLGYMDMLSRFFINDQNNCATNKRGRFTEETKWRLKGHAHLPFWRWVCSWARAVRMPSDLGFNDDGFILPELVENEIELKDLDAMLPEMLFSVPAVGLKEQRDERRITVRDRCEHAAELVNNTGDFATVWCNLNQEGDLLEKMIPDAIQVSGKDSDDAKEEKLVAFSSGKARVIITKPKIGAWGLNWQHCNHTVFFPTHSYEQYYQAIRRQWRFGQRRPVKADLIFTEGDVMVMGSLRRKKKQAEDMFAQLVLEMNNALSVDGSREFKQSATMPKWI